MTDYGKPKVGQEVFSASIRPGIDEEDKVVLTPCVVTRVGTKYFYIQIEQTVGEIAFLIGSWYEKTDYTDFLSLYPSKEEYTEKVEKDKWHQRFHQTFFHQTYFTLAQYRDAAKVLGIQLDG